MKSSYKQTGTAPEVFAFSPPQRRRGILLPSICDHFRPLTATKASHYYLKLRIGIEAESASASSPAPSLSLEEMLDFNWEDSLAEAEAGFNLFVGRQAACVGAVAELTGSLSAVKRVVGPISLLLRKRRKGFRIVEQVLSHFGRWKGREIRVWASCKYMLLGPLIMGEEAYLLAI